MIDANSPLSADEAGMFLEGIRLFDERRFFEAHDVWEELWMETRGEKRLFFQGLIQAAAAYYHALNANNSGAASLLSRSIDKLQRYLPSCCSIDLDPLIAALRAHARTLESARGRPEILIDAAELPSLRPLTHIS